MPKYKKILPAKLSIPNLPVHFCHKEIPEKKPLFFFFLLRLPSFLVVIPKKRRRTPCTKMAATLVTLNAELLDDKNAFSYADLRSLCKRLNLGGNGKRHVLVQRLQEWHRARSPVKSPSSPPPRAARSRPSSSPFAMGSMASDTPSPVNFDPSVANDENQLPMNVPGQRFALLNINVAPAKFSPSPDNDRNIKAASTFPPPPPPRAAPPAPSSSCLESSSQSSSSSSSSSSPLEAEQLLPPPPPESAQSPTTLEASPSIKASSISSTAKKSPGPPTSTKQNRRRRSSLLGGDRGILSPVEHVSPRLLNPLNRKNDTVTPKPILKRESSADGPKSDRRSLVFSPYNGVRIIPHRLDADGAKKPVMQTSSQKNQPSKSPMPPAPSPMYPGYENLYF